MRNLKKLTSVLLALVLCLVLAATGVFAATSDTGTGTATLDEINEISMTDDAIAFGTITAVTGDNAIDTSSADNLTGSTLNSNTPVFWKGEVTSATKPTGAQALEATVKGYIYWSEVSGNATYPAYIDVKDTGEIGCTVTVDWADASTDNLSTGTGNKHAEFTVKYHAWTATTGDAASTNTYRVVFATDNSTVYVKDGNSDWSFTESSADLSANCTALQVSAATGETNYVTGVIGDSGATYVLTTLVTTAPYEVILQLGKKFAFDATTHTQEFFALVDIPNLAAAGDYSWIITVTTAKWNVN